MVGLKLRKGRGSHEEEEEEEGKKGRFCLVMLCLLILNLQLWFISGDTAQDNGYKVSCPPSRQNHAGDLFAQSLYAATVTLAHHKHSLSQV